MTEFFIRSWDLRCLGGLRNLCIFFIRRFAKDREDCVNNCHENVPEEGTNLSLGGNVKTKKGNIELAWLGHWYYKFVQLKPMRKWRDRWEESKLRVQNWAPQMMLPGKIPLAQLSTLDSHVLLRFLITFIPWNFAKAMEKGGYVIYKYALEDTLEMYLESADDLIDQRNEFLNVPCLEQNKENLWIT